MASTTTPRYVFLGRDSEAPRAAGPRGPAARGARGALRRGEKFVGALNVASCQPCAPNQTSWLGAKSIVYLIRPNVTPRTNDGRPEQRRCPRKRQFNGTNHALGRAGSAQHFARASPILLF
jgi:hypothetical protein